MASSRIVIGLSGASGAQYGIRLLERLRDRGDVETHLVVSKAAEKTLHQEMGLLLGDVKPLATHWHPIEAVGATIASGSFLTDGMVVAPCSINTLSAITYGVASNLLVRAADVTLKERRRLILMVRESPLHLGHLRTMTAAAEMGAIIAPPMPDFYNRPQTVDEVVEQGVGRLLDLLNLSLDSTKRWQGV
ncbi:MAG: UbiX family flavin prenyltransferase [Acidobacteria bacterium]|nr:UbiX family flavin prenyltransferase [Acidobacteriota bacterium]